MFAPAVFEAVPSPKSLGALLLAAVMISPTAVASEDTAVTMLAKIDSASIKKGKARAAVCRGCHKVKKGQEGGMGPNLWNLFNREKASQEGYKYTQAMQQAGGKWDAHSLDQFLTKPSKFLPGTRMTFGGIKREKDRLNVIAYLRTLSD